MSEITTTSMIKIRPFIPCLNPDSEEPKAILTYGNVTVELDYTIIGSIRMDNGSTIFSKPTSIFNAAMMEILREMEFDMYGKLHKLHRDAGASYLNSITHYPLHPINKEITI